MLFQIVFRSAEWYQYVINALVATVGRLLDILSTRYVTKELKLETNKLARRLGWKGMILLQIPVIALGSLDFYFAFFIFFWSMLLFANNIEGSWYVKETGEDQYQEQLKARVKNVKKWKIFFGEISSIFTYTISGAFILLFIFVYNDLFAVLIICLSLICQGILSSFRSLSYLLDLKKQKSNQESQKIQQEAP